ncbi:conserved exported hypothetical protein [Candidatus Zixiibacteriota bacterium]|nr:conserved exported hypothetical protein [candidate division Zixibacteria bacterium]
MKSKLISLIVIIGILFGYVMTVSAQEAKKAEGLEQLKFLEGEWIGEGGGQPGQGTGGFSFESDLQGKVLIRKNYAEYPATKEKPAYRHDDLMVISQQPGDTMRAVYWDNEGHVINYTVHPQPDSGSAVFVSEPSQNSPQFRLTYKMEENDRLAIIFEIAPPGQPEAFSRYIEAAAHRK